MSPIRHILVPIQDTLHVSKAQLKKAAQIARAANASIELFHAITDSEHDALRHGNSGALSRVLQQRLERWSKSQIFAGLRTRTYMCEDRPGYKAVSDRARQTRADLVVAAPAKRNFGSRLLLLNRDWQLIRCCPCPLLLVRTPHAYAKPIILTAVDPFHAHAKPTNLDADLVGHAKLAAGLLNGEVHLFHAYTPLNMLLPTRTGEPTWIPREVEEMHTAQVAKVFNTLAQSLGIDPGHCHLAMGDVRGELAAAVRTQRASIVVMGAISRTYLKRLVIGSSAQHVLDSLRADVLIVKPAARQVDAAAAETSPQKRVA